MGLESRKGESMDVPRILVDTQFCQHLAFLLCKNVRNSCRCRNFMVNKTEGCGSGDSVHSWLSAYITHLLLIIPPTLIWLVVLRAQHL